MMKLMVFALIVALASPSYAASLRNAKAVSRDVVAHIRKARAPSGSVGFQIDPVSMTNYVSDPFGPVDNHLDLVKDDSSEEVDAGLYFELQREIASLEANPRLDPDIKAARIAEIKDRLPPKPDAIAPSELAGQANEAAEALKQEASPADRGQIEEALAEIQEQLPSKPDKPDPSPAEPANNNGGEEDGDGQGADNNNNNAADAPAASEAASEAKGAAEAAGGGGPENNVQHDSGNGNGAPDAPGASDPGNDNGNGRDEDTRS